jgi:ribonuclease D
MTEQKIHLYHGDLPDDVDLGNCVAIDTETLGLRPIRDRLCLMQLSSGDGQAHLVKFEEGQYDAPNLKKLLGNPDVTKIFHYARFDIGVIWVYLNILTNSVYCTKIASKLARTFTSNHGLRHVCKDLIDVNLNKQQQSSYWGAKELSPEQLEYAASDVFYLHAVREKLDEILQREGRAELLQACLDFLPHRSVLDIAGFEEEDIFAHH